MKKCPAILKILFLMAITFCSVISQAVNDNVFDSEKI